MNKTRTLSFIIVTLVYILAIIIGLFVYKLLPFHFAINLLISDVVATVVVFIFSLILKTASVYDPYWSVQPIVILTAFAVTRPMGIVQWLLLVAVWFWGVRLTANWAYGFQNLCHQDWRYTHYKEKTGKAGFLFPTTENGGGWNFTNLAWSFGGDFMEETNDGWKADFTDGVTNALKFLRDMKWEDKSLPESTLINNTEAMKMIATDQAAMAFAHPGQLNVLTTQFGMSTDAIGYVKMPEGPGGRVALMGGKISTVSKKKGNEGKIDAALKWIKFNGTDYNIDDTQKAKMEENLQDRVNKGTWVGVKTLSLWDENSENTIDKIFERNNNFQ